VIEHTKYESNFYQEHARSTQSTMSSKAFNANQQYLEDILNLTTATMVTSLHWPNPYLHAPN